MAERFLNPPVHLGEAKDKGTPIDPKDWDAVLAVRLGTHDTLRKNEDKINAAGQTVHENDMPIESRLTCTIPEAVGVSMLFSIAQSILTQVLGNIITGANADFGDGCGSFEDADGVFDEAGFIAHCETEHGIPAGYTTTFLAQEKRAKAAKEN